MPKFCKYPTVFVLAISVIFAEFFLNFTFKDRGGLLNRLSFSG